MVVETVFAMMMIVNGSMDGFMKTDGLSHCLKAKRQLMEADLLKKAEQVPVNQELFMLVEFLAGQNEVMEKEIQSIESNNINIDFLKTQVEKLQRDVEDLKDKVRYNGS